ncbi:uncharacterized protein RHOBADRAFT_50557 [Rhodotorula graminis WP1]|uniref:Protein EFR3 n=1 Tax=Rhodotorula graminis (strain WP1) TaxID=578459 RepID=A0A194SEU3_RHOGW|nr:uncharacterized protein RHOBADRAFT_50557 [Rhodotorula graminis WP1]KPV78036.1 hypothetical protein RHOBADRAFT_50557 [Rhodotorula graminis WP1]
MGLLPTPNHVALIRDCYVQPHSSSSSSSPSASSPLPQPASNALSKLTFYAVNRPTKIPKVVAHLVERASKARASSGPKARADLAVTVDIVRGLVVETGESGKEGAGELIKGAMAEEALRIAEMALGGEGGKGDLFSTAQVRSGKRDPEMEARGASLFHAVATFLTAPFLGASDGVGKQYLRCLSLVSGLAQLQGPGNAESRFIALKALDGAARSEYLYATGGEYDRQVEELVPALLRNCLDTDIDNLRANLSSTLADDKSLQPNPTSLASRKTSSISLPDDASKLPADSTVALPILLLLSRLSTVPQLLSLHASFASFLDQHEAGHLWHGESQPVVLFLARAFLAAAPAGHRAPVVAWWSDQAGDIYDRDTQHRSITLLFVLKQLIEPTTATTPQSEEVAVEGLSAGGVLNTLVELLVRRARLSSPVGTPNGLRESPALGSDPTPTDPDPLLRPLLAVVAALARSSAARGYPSQLDDLASDVIDLLRALKLEEGRAERLVSGMTSEEKCLAKVRVVKALRTLLQEAPRPAAVNGDSSFTVKRSPVGDDVLAAARSNGASADELDPELIRPRPVAGASNGTLKRVASLEAPGALGLGRPLNGTSPALHDGDARLPLDAEQPILRVSTPGGASTTPPRSRDPSASRPSNGPPLSSTEMRRQPVAPRTFARSLFILTEPDLRLRVEYAGAAAVYVSRELPLVVSTSSGSAGSADELASFWRQLHAGVYGLAIGESSPPSSSSARDGAVDGAQHALHRTRSARSLRSQRSTQSFHDRDDVAHVPASSSRSAPGAADYAALAALVEAVPRVPAAVLEGVPALLALDAKAATRWEVGLAGGAELGGEGGGADPARAQACREVAARGLKAVGRAWGLTELEQLGQEALVSLSPFVIPADARPSSGFAARPTAAPAALNASLVIDILATDSGLQKAAQLDRTSLASLLAQPWSYEAAKVEASSALRSPYFSSALPSRSLINLAGPSRSRAGSRAGSTFRLASSPPLTGGGTSLHPQSIRSSVVGSGGGGPGSLAPSTRSRFGHVPSLADLQAGLAGTSIHTATRSARTSAAPSVVSSVGGTGGWGTGGSGTGGSDAGAGSGLGRRRTSRATPESVLERVGRRNRAGTGASSLSAAGTGGGPSAVVEAEKGMAAL